jgi:GTPase SAR1 family protein
MLIILEGADGSGKTSLANRIRKEVDEYMLFLRSNGAPQHVGQLADVIGWVAEIPYKIPVIQDRNPVISEYIYGPIIRGKCMHGLNLDQMVRMFRTSMIIYCRPSYSALAAGMRQEVQMEGVALNHKEIVKAYDEFMSQLGKTEVLVKPYDFTGPFDLLRDAIRSFIMRGRKY